MTEKLIVKPPMWFWIIGVIALIWNLMGVSAYLMDAFMSAEALQTLPEAERLLYESRPIWATACYAVAVWAGLAGAVGLLWKKKWAKTAFMLSLAGILLQQLYHFFLSNTFEVLGSAAMAFPIVIILIGIGLVAFANYSIKQKWLI
ncbi:hypothetical protein KCTC52924_03179 [Arenibacter antarcticus]|uniref:Sugar transporter n=1 Tax=Arenibacter antarcticus TaxID=2040469 RepID=A0ABW5VK46_9FLAO|nr:hypothetical protein [Arenibacter sp. H213]MCM4166254.1 hypothetical protein [Arenibacter sp. H213]